MAILPSAVTTADTPYYVAACLEKGAPRKKENPAPLVALVWGEDTPLPQQETSQAEVPPLLKHWH